MSSIDKHAHKRVQTHAIITYKAFHSITYGVWTLHREWERRPRKHHGAGDESTEQRMNSCIHVLIFGSRLVPTM